MSKCSFAIHFVAIIAILVSGAASAQKYAIADSGPVEPISTALDFASGSVAPTTCEGAGHGDGPSGSLEFFALGTPPPPPPPPTSALTTKSAREPLASEVLVSRGGSVKRETDELSLNLDQAAAGNAGSTCNEYWDDTIPEPLWLDMGGEWTDARRERIHQAMDLAIVWLESFVQQLDVIENGEDQAEALYWSALPTSESSLATYFGDFNLSRMLAVRHTAQRMLIIMTAQGYYSVLRVEAGDNNVGTCADGFSAWSLGTKIGFCLDTLDDEEDWGIEALAGLLLHEVAHQAGVGHAIAPYCTGGRDNEECRRESQTKQLAEEDPDLTLNNADSFRFAIMRHGQEESWCRPTFTVYYTGAGWGGTDVPNVSVVGFQLCTMQAPLVGMNLLCRDKLWSDDPEMPYCEPGRERIGSTTFAWCH